MEKISIGEVSNTDGYICTTEDLKKLVNDAVTTALQNIEKKTTSKHEVVI